ncbi:MAG: Type 1 glutamine amidotransferase-like domain-containing protein [Candidatus Moraniibacteriota bacterium]
MKTIVAIGGGELGEWETLPIDREIVRLSRKTTPTVLFIPTASGDSEKYWEIFQRDVKHLMP